MSDGFVLALELMVAPIGLAFLVWCYYKITNDPGLKMPAKMTTSILESEDVPEDWSNLHKGNPSNETGDELESSYEATDSEEDQKSKALNKNKPKMRQEKSKIPNNESGHGHSHNGKPCSGHDEPERIKLGVGPIGGNTKRPDPRTMKLMLLESIKQKKEDLEDNKQEMDKADYEKQLKALNNAENNAKNMPTDPKEIEKMMEKRALENARKMAKTNISNIQKQQILLEKAKAENKVPAQVYYLNMQRMKSGEEQFKKMIDADDEELKVLIEDMNRKMAEMQKAHKLEILKKKQAAAAANKKSEITIKEIEDDEETETSDSNSSSGIEDSDSNSDSESNVEESEFKIEDSKKAKTHASNSTTSRRRKNVVK